MSQVVDVDVWVKASAPKTSARKPLLAVGDMSDGALADEHRGHTFALERAKARLKEIAGELDRRGVISAKGEVSFVSRQLADIGLLDLKRLRADLGDDICREYAIAGSNEFWCSRTLKPEERTSHE